MFRDWSFFGFGAIFGFRGRLGFRTFLWLRGFEVPWFEERLGLRRLLAFRGCLDAKPDRPSVIAICLQVFWNIPMNSDIIASKLNPQPSYLPKPAMKIQF